MYVSIKPKDGLVFNNGTSFKPEDNAWITSMQQPHPSTLYGALFSLLYVHDQDVRDALNDIKKEDPQYDEKLEGCLKKYLTIKNIYLTDGKDIYIRVPQDVYCNGSEHVGYGKFVKDGNDMLLHPPKGDLKPVSSYDYYMTLGQFRTYARRDYLSSVTSWEELWNYAPRMGIQLQQNKKQAEDGMLFRVDMLEKVCFDLAYLVEIDVKNTSKFPEEGILKLGGEAKTCYYEKIAKTPYAITQYKGYEKETYAQHVKMMTTTPTVFCEKEKGICYSTPKLKGFQIVGAAMDKPIMIGGYDMKKRMPKTIYHAVPAGAIYLMKGEKSMSLSNIRKMLQEELREKVVDDYKGFGQFMLVPYTGEAL
ncbi:type III-B CRISPR module-associated protein Cmr3 [Vallitalea pronyensis]|uniref:Type III-B CRISPR module-associated protein Cmr3 n=1 Tax=Vallitalea pronyensis TaxID=1348613 RepID=A0A8J8SI10_9FIRM|nr:type III-B CRISPR module-associated protein Cmr3 [Vallitalea pronyensis]QUI23984.1 type III-B CRISPR module-associated protein Cmr3 [Vallitalea pronyensis]